MNEPAPCTHPVPGCPGVGRPDHAFCRMARAAGGDGEATCLLRRAAGRANAVAQPVPSAPEKPEDGGKGPRAARGIAAVSASQEGRAARLAAEGRKLWAELHAFALRWDGDRATAEAWLADFRRRIPSGGGCGCRESWDKAIGADPPSLEDARSLFSWSVRIHNTINRKLQKPQMDEAAARSYWGAEGQSV